MTSHEEGPAWQDRLVELQLCSSGQADEALANTLILPVAGRDGSRVDAEALTAQLVDVLESYSAKASAQGLKGAFYCWFDELSGTVRCSFSTNLTPQGLPFESRLLLLPELADVVRQVRGAQHCGEIPFEELQHEEWDLDEVEQEFVLALWMTVVPGDDGAAPLLG